MMATYSDWEWREMERDPAWDKRPAAVPTQSFDVWLQQELEQQQAEEIEALVEMDWTEDEARAFVNENPRE